MLVLVLAAYLTTHPATAEVYGSGWYREVQLTVGTESNVPRSYKGPEEFSDMTTTASVGLGYSSKHGENVQAVIAGYVSHTRHDEFSDLDHLAVSLAGSLTWQPMLRFDRPWYQFELDVTRLDHENSAPRDGYLATASVSANRRFGMRGTARIGYRYLDLIFDKPAAQATLDAAFDVDRHEVFAGIDYRLAGSAWLALGYSFQHGDHTSSSAEPAINMTKYYDAQSRDRVFDRCSVEPCSHWYAYRNVADVHSVDVAVLFPVGPVNVDLSAQLVSAKARSGLEYRNVLTRLGLIWTF